MQAKENHSDSLRGRLGLPTGLRPGNVVLALRDQAASLAPQPAESIHVFKEELAGGGTQFIPAPRLRSRNPSRVNVCAGTRRAMTWVGPQSV
jgi:hypothetical protein